jgi:hypothetical protein
VYQAGRADHVHVAVEHDVDEVRADASRARARAAMAAEDRRAGDGARRERPRLGGVPGLNRITAFEEAAAGEVGCAGLEDEFGARAFRVEAGG